MMRKIWILLIGAILIASAETALALKEEQRERVRQQISSVKVWQMTRDLDLSEQQAQLFFPAQRDYETRKEELRRQREAVEAELDGLLRAGKGKGNERLILAQLERMKDIDREIGAHEMEFRRKLSRVLTLEQQARYELFEKRFDARLRQMIRDIQEEDRMARDRALPDARRYIESEAQDSMRKERIDRDNAQRRDERQEKRAPERDSGGEREGRKKSGSDENKSSGERSSREKGSSDEKSTRSR